MKGVIEDHYRRTIPVFGQMALKQVKSRRIERKAAQTIYESLIADWISREALRKATMIADTDRDDVMGAINTGISEGLGTEDIGRRIRKVTQMTPHRAATVARTETHAAATFGSIESVREAERELGVVMVKEWLATRDDRTRPEHLAADGQKVGMDEKFSVGGESMDRPGDSAASGANTVNCLHPGSVIDSGRVQAVTRHWYEGLLVVIETASGNKVATTPNHPVLTRGGWVAAAALNKGDSVISGVGHEGISLRDLNVENVKASIEQIYNALAVKRGPVRITRVRVNFHGDVPDGDVDVVRTAGKLGYGLIATLLKPLRHLRLAHADLAQGKLLAESLLFRTRAMKLGRLVSDRLVSLGRPCESLVRCCLGRAQQHAFAAVSRSKVVVAETGFDVLAIPAEGKGQGLNGLAQKKAIGNLLRVHGSLALLGGNAGGDTVAERDARPLEPAMNGLNRNAVFVGKLLKAESRKVFVDEVSSISQFNYSGYVYNLETETGYYTCNGIVQHNCRCAIIYEEKGG